MKHFTDLTPHASDALAATSDRKTVLFTAFRKGDTYALHMLNLGPARAADLERAQQIAKKTGVGYQTVLKQAIREGLKRAG